MKSNIGRVPPMSQGMKKITFDTVWAFEDSLTDRERGWFEAHLLHFSRAEAERQIRWWMAYEAYASIHGQR